MTFDILSFREDVSIFISREQASGREEEARKRGWCIEAKGGEGGGGMGGSRITRGFIFGRGLGRRLKSRCTPACLPVSSAPGFILTRAHGTIHLVPSGHSDYWFHGRAKESKPSLPSHLALRAPLRALARSCRVPFLHLVSSRKRKLAPLRFFVRLSLRYGT